MSDRLKCRKCMIEKTLQDFHKGKNICKECRRECRKEEENRCFASKTEHFCRKCEKTKPISEFHKNKWTCKECTAISQREYRVKNPDAVIAVERKSKKKNIVQRTKYNNEYRRTYNGFCKGLLNGCRASDKKYKRNDFDLDLDWIEEQKKKQNNKCIYTGLELIWGVNNKQKASIDRIDNTKGHSKTNCHLCIFPINLIKLNMAHNDFLKHLGNLKNKKFESYSTMNFKTLTFDEKKIVDRIYYAMKYHSKKSGLDFDLRREQYDEFIREHSTCAYTGIPVVYREH